MGTIIEDVRGAVATAVTAGGIPCQKYQETRIPTQLPACDLWLESFEANAENQKVGISSIDLILTIYQHAGPRNQKAQEYVDEHIQTILTALGADPTLSNKIRSWTFQPGRVRVYAAQAEGSGKRYVVCEIGIRVTPHPNAA